MKTPVVNVSLLQLCLLLDAPAYLSSLLFLYTESLYLLLEFSGFVLSWNSPLGCVFIGRCASLLTQGASSTCQLLCCFLLWLSGLWWWQKIPLPINMWAESVAEQSSSRSQMHPVR